MMEPLPYCFSICDSAAANALDLLSSIAVPLFLDLSASTAAHLGQRSGPTPDTV
jgi:hypothetical protein